jgi:3-oxoacyl-[acyl-carrier protein] reductase
MIDPGLEGKVALVTSANHGIGAATALALARLGAAVFVTYLRIPPRPGVIDPGVPGGAQYEATRGLGAEAAVEAIRAAGGRVEALEVDLAGPAVVPGVFERAEAAFGPVAILVNNAAVGGPPKDTFLPAGLPQSNPYVELHAGTPLPLSADSHDRHFAVNSRAVALMMAEFARRHVERGATWGRIVNISTDGAAGFPGEVSYGASKAALESYSRAAAGELARFGVTVNVISPGPIQTGWISAELEAALLPTIPLGRMGRPEDVADAIVFLASEQARWLTGQTLHVGGGHRMV